MKTRSQTANGGNGSKWIRPEKRLALYLRDSFGCAYCGRDLHDARPAEITLDHLESRSNGGHHHESNLVTACRSCNSSRQDRPWRQYATGGAIERIERLRRRSIRRHLTLAKALIAGRAGDKVAEAATVEAA